MKEKKNYCSELKKIFLLELKEKKNIYCFEGNKKKRIVALGKNNAFFKKKNYSFDLKRIITLSYSSGIRSLYLKLNRQVYIRIILFP